MTSVTVSRDVDVVEVPTPQLARGRHVVVAIGIDDYQHWRKLDNAVSDADGVVALFEQLGFVQVRPALRDASATGQALDALVAELEHLLGPEDSLVVFFAGHGTTRTQQVGRRRVNTGYLVPVDGTEGARGAASWIELEPWLRGLARLPPRHVLVILDACFSGAALSVIRWGRGSGSLPGLPFEVANTKHSRLLIASTLEAQRAQDDGPAPGHSLFTGCLIEALSGGAKRIGERDGRAVTIGSELAHYVRHRVQTYGGRPGWDQTPDFGTFDHDDRGEMYIPLLAERASEHDSAAALASGSARIAESGATTTVASASRVATRARRWWLAGALAAAAGALIAVARQRGDDDRPTEVGAQDRAPAIVPNASGESRDPGARTQAEAAARRGGRTSPPEVLAPNASSPNLASLDTDHGGDVPFCEMQIKGPTDVLVSWDGVEHEVPVSVPIVCGTSRTIRYHKPGKRVFEHNLSGRVNSKPLILRPKDGGLWTDDPTGNETAAPSETVNASTAVGEEMGRLILTLTPACKIAIDGTGLDRATSRIDRPLSVGRHHIILQSAAGLMSTEDVDIEAKQTTQRAFACPR